LEENKDSWIKQFPEWITGLLDMVGDFAANSDIFPIEQVSICLMNVCMQTLTA
jgi:hypothetical protein